MELDDKILEEVADRIVKKMEARLHPLVGALEALAETNEILMERVAQLEWMLGLSEPACTCSRCTAEAATTEASATFN